MASKPLRPRAGFAGQSTAFRGEYGHYSLVGGLWLKSGGTWV